jgi:hypothetical protein
MFGSDIKIDRRKYKGQGPVKYNDVRTREREFFFSLTLCSKTMSYVLWQMVNVHGRWTHMRERKRIGDDDDASLWPNRRRQQIELAIMCLSSCLARTNERKKGLGWSSGLASYARIRLRRLLSMLDDSVKKNKNATCNSFTILFHHRFSFFLL